MLHVFLIWPWNPKTSLPERLPIALVQSYVVKWGVSWVPRHVFTVNVFLQSGWVFPLFSGHPFWSNVGVVHWTFEWYFLRPLTMGRCRALDMPFYPQGVKLLNHVKKLILWNYIWKDSVKWNRKLNLVISTLVQDIKKKSIHCFRQVTPYLVFKRDGVIRWIELLCMDRSYSRIHVLNIRLKKFANVSSIWD